MTLRTSKAVRFHPVSADYFAGAISVARTRLKGGRLIAEWLTPYRISEYEDMHCFAATGGQAGYAIKADGDLVSVFSTERGLGDQLVADAVANGAKKVDVFDEDGFLPRLYGRHGFVEYFRDRWNDEYAPEGWTGGRPDVVYMRLER